MVVAWESLHNYLYSTTRSISGLGCIPCNSCRSVSRTHQREQDRIAAWSGDPIIDLRLNSTCAWSLPSVPQSLCFGLNAA
mmetsp:Transcript_143020/g.362993  ORF Transcript_143020/g.362993 Transcript_143020/m.362993 type:complete len:80 (-) Transcript_143020:84-323(-)